MYNRLLFFLCYRRCCFRCCCCYRCCCCRRRRRRLSQRDNSTKHGRERERERGRLLRKGAVQPTRESDEERKMKSARALFLSFSPSLASMPASWKGFTLAAPASTTLPSLSMTSSTFVSDVTRRLASSLRDHQRRRPRRRPRPGRGTDAVAVARTRRRGCH